MAIFDTQPPCMYCNEIFYNIVKPTVCVYGGDDGGWIAGLHIFSIGKISTSRFATSSSLSTADERLNDLLPRARARPKR